MVVATLSGVAMVRDGTAGVASVTLRALAQSIRRLNRRAPTKLYA
jgi:hypothetical protein